MLPEAQPAATVVVCEDDEPTLELLCDHLEADRFRALPAPSASDALRLCHYKQPDLLLLDLRLPDASGLDVLREIRASEGATGRYDPALPVIVLSGRGTDTDRVRGFAEGADDYIVKPSRCSLSDNAGALWISPALPLLVLSESLVTGRERPALHGTRYRRPTEKWPNDEQQTSLHTVLADAPILPPRSQSLTSQSGFPMAGPRTMNSACRLPPVTDLPRNSRGAVLDDPLAFMKDRR